MPFLDPDEAGAEQGPPAPELVEASGPVEVVRQRAVLQEEHSIV